MVSKVGAVIRAFASYQRCPGSNPSVDTICGWSLLLVVSLALTGFSVGTLVFPPVQQYFHMVLFSIQLLSLCMNSYGVTTHMRPV